MPRWLRKFTFDKILKRHQSQQGNENDLDVQVSNLKKQNQQQPDYISKKRTP